LLFATLVNCLVIAVVVLVHYEVLHNLFIWIPRLPIPRRMGVVVAVFGSLIAHAVEVWVFGATYYWLISEGTHGNLVRGFNGSFMDCVYYSFVCYTSLGFGDIEPTGHLRFLSGLESLVGLVLIGWTASFIYVEMTRFWREPEG
jgi:hypothetical protein